MFFFSFCHRILCPQIGNKTVEKYIPVINRINEKNNHSFCLINNFPFHFFQSEVLNLL